MVDINRRNKPNSYAQIDSGDNDSRSMHGNDVPQKSKLVRNDSPNSIRFCTVRVSMFGCHQIHLECMEVRQAGTSHTDTTYKKEHSGSLT